MLCIVYQIKNDVNDKLYIGVTNQSLHARMRDHKNAARRGVKKPLYIAMRELGIKHFFIEHLETINAERHVAESRETAYIRELGTVYPQGYNLRAPLTNEQVAIIRYDLYQWPYARYAEVFNIRAETVSLIRNKTWIYPHVTEKDLPASAKIPAPLDSEWIKTSEAAAILSEKSGRLISSGYVRQLAHDAELRNKISDDRAYVLIHRGDCEAYTVRDRRTKQSRNVGGNKQ